MDFEEFRERLMEDLKDSFQDRTGKEYTADANHVKKLQNAGEKIATVYTRDRAVMRKLDALVTEFPDIYRCVSESDMEKCYEMPKSHVSYRKPRKITEAKREQAREQMKKINRGDLH